ncbi:MAG TPA: hypothetical protein VEB40_05630 [Flavipsychrobacter sp.]|nr:hypothetical protein [Flavipsychrobacter sp.]
MTLHVYRLPDFLDYLSVHYKQLYQLYAGRLTELFPCSEPTENSLQIQDEEKSPRRSNELLMELWKKFRG